MLKAVLFDLDNTLLLLDERKFIDSYFRRISTYFESIMPDGLFRERLIKAFRAMNHGSGRASNYVRFMDAFARGFENDREALWERFMTFYKKDYDRIEKTVKRPPGLTQVFDGLINGDLKLVLATNPIFPLEAQYSRLSWIGMENVPFGLITHIENMSYVKPQTAYYREICEMIEEPPHACLMVGNDKVNDMVAAKEGICTYLTTDARDAKGFAKAARAKEGQGEKPDIPEPDFQGPLAEVPKAIHMLRTG